MTLRIGLLCLFLFITLTLKAQDITVKGRVISDEDNLPVQNVSIKIENSDATATSNRIGEFEITGPVNSVLIFTKEGFVDFQQKIIDQSEITIRIKKISLVSIGYGDVSNRDVTGSIVSISYKDFNKGIIGSPEQLMQGKLAGVQVTTGSGEPGSMVQIYIRSISSLRGSNPLFVLDGFPLTPDDVYATSTNFGKGTSPQRDPLNFIDPNDIERIDILKDASSAAIYGSRGNNGVVLITTKSGSGVNQLQFSSQISLSKQRKYYDLLNDTQYINGINDVGGNGNALDFGDNTDWQKEVGQTGFSQKYNLSYSNGYKTGNYRISFGYEDQQGIIKETGLKRLTGRINWNQSLLHDKLKITGRLSTSGIRDEFALITTNAGFDGDLLGSVYTANPTWEDNADMQYPGPALNPLSILKYHDDHAKTNRSMINFSFSYAILSHITLGLNVGRDIVNSTRKAAVSPTLQMANGVLGNGRASIKTVDTKTDYFESWAKYEKEFDQSKVTALFGYGFQSYNQEQQRVEGWGFGTTKTTNMLDDLKSSDGIIRDAIPTSYNQYGYSPTDFFVTQLHPTPTVIDLNSVKPTAPVSSVIRERYATTDGQQSLYARLIYSYQSRFTFLASLRADASTLFGTENPNGLFPSFSGEWKISEEKFVPSFFSDLRLRVGFGISGGQNISHGAADASAQFSTLAISQNGNIPIPGYYITGLGNQTLKWEQASEFNAGLNFGIGGNKFQGSLDFYHKTTTDFLALVLAPQPSPVSTFETNADGKIINTGMELSIQYWAINKPSFDFTINANVAYNRNTLKDFAGTLTNGFVFGQGVSGGSTQRIQSNHPLYSYYMYKFTGFDSNGLSLYGDGYQKFVGQDPIPDVVLGFGFDGQLKNWYASVSFSGLIGYSLYSNTNNAYFTKGSLANGRNVTTYVLTSNESPSNSPEVSTRFLEKADFIRMQNASIGYNFYFSKRPFKSIITYITGQNLFVWTNYSGLDPDVNSGQIGMDYTTYPMARSISLGLKVTF